MIKFYLFGLYKITFVNPIEVAINRMIGFTEVFMSVSTRRWFESVQGIIVLFSVIFFWVSASSVLCASPDGNSSSKVRSPYPEEHVYSGYKLEPLGLKVWQPGQKKKSQHLKLDGSDRKGSKENLVLIPVFTSCPVTCPTILKDFEAVLGGLGGMKGSPGSTLDPAKLRVVVVSFDPKDSVRSFAGLVTRQKLPSNWLYGVPSSKTEMTKLRAILAKLDFRYQTLPADGGFAHPAGAYIFDRQGKVTRFLAQAEFTPEDIVSAVNGGSKGGTGSIGKSPANSASGKHHTGAHPGHMGHN